MERFSVNVAVEARFFSACGPGYKDQIVIETLPAAIVSLQQARIDLKRRTLHGRPEWLDLADKLDSPNAPFVDRPGQ